MRSDRSSFLSVRRPWRFVSVALLGAAFPTAAVVASDWLQFRGPDFAGNAATEKLPTEWGPDKNVAWRVDLPGRGPSSPIVVDGRVIVTSSGGEGRQEDRIYVDAYSAETGERLWTRRFDATGRPFSHPSSSNAAPTPVSDGERVYAFFSSNDLACLSVDGDLIWYRGLTYDYPKAANDVGMASSPVLAGDVVVVQIENQGDSFVAGIDKRTGETRWRHERAAEANWGSPIAFRSGEVDYALVVSRKGATAYRADDGTVAWDRPGAGSSISSSVVLGDRLLLPYDGLLLLDVSGEAPADVWSSPRMRPSNTSPVVSGNTIYLLSSSGVLTGVDLSTGERAWQARVGGSFWSTPVVSGDHLYAFSEAGMAIIVRLDGANSENVAEYDLGAPILASPAAAGDALFVRTDNALWKFSTK